MDEFLNLLDEDPKIGRDIIEFIDRCEEEIKEQFKALEYICDYNSTKILRAMQKEKVALRHFSPSSGYGYDDIGRDTLDKLFARVFGAQDALIRPQIASGTHAISATLLAILRSGDCMLSVCGQPYDTLLDTLGLAGDAWGSFTHYGIEYKQVSLKNNEMDDQAVLKILRSNKNIRVIYIQRSRGYNWREALTIEQIQEFIQVIKMEFPDILVVVDNCYGEFTQTKEPCEVGADLMVGSLIKNPGGGIAPTGGYIAGKAEWVERIANRLTAPGIGREVGSYAASYTPFYQGLFLAAHVVCQSLKGAVLAARIFEKCGFETIPASKASRGDIIQAICFRDKKALIDFCQSIQQAAPVDSYVKPEPWDMPGYQDSVIMAAGSFIQGSSIELSADAPIKEPYIAYMQGGLHYSHVKYALMLALNNMKKLNQINLVG